MATITPLNAAAPLARPVSSTESDAPPRPGVLAIATVAAAEEVATGTLGESTVASERKHTAATRRDPAAEGAIDEALGAAVERLNEQAISLQRSLRFSIDQETGRTVIKVLDRDTDEVIRQIPPEYTMEILRRMDVGAGLILQEKA